MNDLDLISQVKMLVAQKDRWANKENVMQQVSDKCKELREVEYSLRRILTELEEITGNVIVPTSASQKRREADELVNEAIEYIKSQNGVTGSQLITYLHIRNNNMRSLLTQRLRKHPKIETGKNGSGNVYYWTENKLIAIKHDEQKVLKEEFNHDTP